MTTLAVTSGLAWALALLMHWWPRLSGDGRRRASLATSALGIAFLVAALRAEGLRESALESVVLAGPAILTATTSASASLCYYVLTAVCLLLGFAGLAFGDPLSRWLRPRMLLSSAAVAWLVTVVRFLLEKSAAPVLLVQAVGVTWFAPVAGAYFATGLLPAPPIWRLLLRTLVAYAFLVRGFVALVGILATQLGLGTHYDVSAVTSLRLALTGGAYTLVPASWQQALWLTLVPQLVVWPAFTVLAGMLGGALAVAPRRRAGGASRSRI